MTMCSVQCVSIDWLISARVGLNSYVRTSEVNRLIVVLAGLTKLEPRSSNILSNCYDSIGLLLATIPSLLLVSCQSLTLFWPL